MTIRNIDTFVSRLWDWGFLDDAFKYGIRVTDVDGLVERNGRFLMLEAKGQHATIPIGQRKLFNALHATGVFTILILFGDSPATITTMVEWPDNPRPASRDTVRRRVRAWFEMANH